jgi:thiol:disulfide interchange protein
MMKSAGQRSSTVCREAGAVQVILLLFTVAALALAVSCGKGKQKEEIAGGGIEWLTSFDAALSTAGEQNLPVMIDFYTDWCGWCKKLDSETYVDNQVVAAAVDFVSVKINADLDRETASRYKITGFPTILFVDAAGSEIHRVIGYRPAQDFLREMKAAQQASKGRS